MGQGLNTKVAQTVAHVLQVPLDKISIKPSNTLSAPNAAVTGGSVGSENSCHVSIVVMQLAMDMFVLFNYYKFQSAKRACEILLERLKPIKDENPTAEWSSLIDKAYEKNVDLAATFMYGPTDNKDYDIWAASCCEVEVDILTGNIQLRRVDIMEDVGESLSPGIDVGQIEGSFIMGLGYWLHEKLVFDRESGELLTNRTWTYKPPGVKDIPIDFRVTFLKKSSNPFGVLRSKGKLSSNCEHT